jgi:hypothetical protein
MSLLSDVFEGNFSNVGNDISDAPSSFVRDLPSEEPYLIGAGALGALATGGLLLGPELLGTGAAAAGGDLAAGGIDAAAGGLDAANTTFGAFDPGIIAAEGGDAGTALGTAETAGALDEPALAALDPAAAAIDPAATAVGAVDPALSGIDPASALAFDSPATDVLGGGTGGVGSIFTDSGAFSPGTFDTALPEDVSALTSPSAIDQSALATSAVDPAALTSGAIPETTATAGETGGIANLANTEITAPAATTGASTAASNVLGIPGVSNMQLGMLGLGAAPLAMTLAMGQPQLPSSATALQSQANALSAQGQQDLSNARAGILNAGQSAQIAVMGQNLTNQWLQTLKNQGVMDPTKDSRWPEIQAQIDQQTTAATAQMLQQNMTNALAETGQAASALTSIAQMQVTQDANFTNNLIGATKSLGTVAAIGLGGVKPTVQVAA